MRPGDLHPNEFELALLERLLAENAVAFAISDLHVISREFTGVGSFTNFLVRNAAKTARKVLDMTGTVVVPGLRYGLGVVAFYEGNSLLLETYSYGGEKWDGVFDDFKLESTA